jgi:hypothetical protein
VIENKDNMSIINLFSPIIDKNNISNELKQDKFSKIYLKLDTENITKFLEKLSILDINNDI